MKYSTIIAFVIVLLAGQPEQANYFTGIIGASAAWHAQKPEKESRLDPLILILRVGEDRKILLNREEAGTLDDTKPLKAKLHDLFAERERVGAFKQGMENRVDLPSSERIEKSIYVTTHPSLKETEVSGLIEQIRQTGASPIIILSEKEFNEKFGWLEILSSPHVSPPIAGTFRGGLLHAGVLNGKAIDFPRPTYPANAKAKHVSGLVKVQILIDETGNVISASVISGPPLLRRAALEAARGTRFAPTLFAGKPVKVSGILQYNFVG